MVLRCCPRSLLVSGGNNKYIMEKPGNNLTTWSKLMSLWGTDGHHVPLDVRTRERPSISFTVTHLEVYHLNLIIRKQRNQKWRSFSKEIKGDYILQKCQCRRRQRLRKCSRWNNTKGQWQLAYAVTDPVLGPEW